MYIVAETNISIQLIILTKADNKQIYYTLNLI